MELGCSFIAHSTAESLASLLCCVASKPHDYREPTQTDSALKAFYCSSRLRTKKVACQNLFSRRRNRATNFHGTFFYYLEQLRVLLPLHTCYFHFKTGPVVQSENQLFNITNDQNTQIVQTQEAGVTCTLFIFNSALD